MLRRKGVITDEDIQSFVNALDAVLTECQNPLGPMWGLGANLVKAYLSNRSGAS